jgi:hypothetical protein
VYVAKRTWLYDGPARQRRAGLGDAAACGDNPCTWWDEVYLRDACMNYLACADPANPLLITAQRGLIVGGAQVLGQTAGQATAAGVTAAFQNPDGSTNWTFITVAGLGGLLALKLLFGPVPQRGRR